MNLIIAAPLSEPPSESLPFRYVTLVSRHELNLDVLVEVEQEMKDSYYRYMSRKGLLDYVSQLIIPKEREPGIRIDSELIADPTIRTKSVRWENVVSILGKVKSYI